MIDVYSTGLVTGLLELSIKLAMNSLTELILIDLMSVIIRRNHLHYHFNHIYSFLKLACLVPYSISYSIS